MSSPLKAGVIINIGSGGSDEDTGVRIAAILREAGLPDARYWPVSGDELEGALKEALFSGIDTLIVFGGDGTIRTAAAQSTMDGPVLIPLPGGTMNLLPKALYGDIGWEEVLRATLQNPMTRVISGGKVGKERFFIAAVIGAPALWAKAREAVRDGEIGVALEEGKAALEKTFDSSVRYRFNELHEGTAEAISVICPLISTTLADDRQVLEAAVVDVHGAGEVLQLATAAAFGQWRDAGNVAIVNTKSVIVSASSAIPLILDGETINVGSSLEVEFVPEAFKVMVPAA